MHTSVTKPNGGEGVGSVEGVGGEVGQKGWRIFCEWLVSLGWAEGFIVQEGGRWDWI